MRPAKRRQPSATSAPIITASELGSYAFCPMAWYLRRLGEPPDEAAERRLSLGRGRHLAVGRATDRLRAARMARLLLLVLAACLALVGVLVARGVIA